MAIFIVCHVVNVGGSFTVTFAVFEHTMMRYNKLALVHMTCWTRRTVVVVSNDIRVVLCLLQDEFTTGRVGL